jgi:hypothetical protein
MSRLTVPNAGTHVGRAARPQFEASGAGAEIAKLGDSMMRLGGAIQQNRIARTSERLAVDLQNDMNQLRLRVEEIGDPDELDAAWSSGVEALRSRYFGADPETGQSRVPAALQERFGVRFDDVAGRHAYGLGARSLELRRSEREANWINYRHAATNAAAGRDSEMREGVLAQAQEIIDGQVADGTITPEQGARRRLDLERDLDQAQLTIDMERDPAGTIERLQGDGYVGLTAEERARAIVQAERAVSRQAEEDETARNQELGELIAVMETGQPAANAGILDDPAYQDLPRYAEAVATRELIAERGNIRQMTIPQLREALAEERQRPITRRWQAERVGVIEAALEDAVSGWGSDPIAQADAVGFNVPEFVAWDPADPEAFAEMLAARGRTADALVSEGYTSDRRLFSEDEQAQIREVAATSQDPAARAQLADLLYRAGAIGVVEDPVFEHVGGLGQSGVAASTRAEILRGQQAIEAGTIDMPPAAERLGAAFDEFGDLFANVPGGEDAQMRVMEAADALYAARIRRSDPAGSFDERVYRQALHEVMGGTGRYNRREARGGVQEYNDVLTIMPRGVSAADFEGALGSLQAVAEGQAAVRGRDGVDSDLNAAVERLAAASMSGRPPAVGGRLMAPADLAGLEVRALADDRYVFIWRSSSGERYVTDAEGEPYVFSMVRLIEGAAQ